MLALPGPIINRFFDSLVLPPACVRGISSIRVMSGSVDIIFLKVEVTLLTHQRNSALAYSDKVIIALTLASKVTILLCSKYL